MISSAATFLKSEFRASPSTHLNREAVSPRTIPLTAIRCAELVDKSNALRLHLHNSRCPSRRCWSGDGICDVCRRPMCTHYLLEQFTAEKGLDLKPSSSGTPGRCWSAASENQSDDRSGQRPDRGELGRDQY
jgi:hypothetical protein